MQVMESVFVREGHPTLRMRRPIIERRLCCPGVVCQHGSRTKRGAFHGRAGREAWYADSDSVGRSDAHAGGGHRKRGEPYPGHHYTREADRLVQILLVIITDGEENASRRYGAKQVRAMIAHEQKKYG